MNLRRDVFQALANPTRRAILSMLVAQSMTAGNIAESFATARPTISKHLQILSECKLIKSQQKGREIHYYCNPKKLKPAYNYLKPFVEMWENRFDKLEKTIKKYV